MSKRNSDGDVIANRLSLVEAKGQKFLASLLGPQTEPSQPSNGANPQDEDEDLKEVFGHDRYIRIRVTDLVVRLTMSDLA